MRKKKMSDLYLLMTIPATGVPMILPRPWKSSVIPTLLQSEWGSTISGNILVDKHTVPPKEEKISSL